MGHNLEDALPENAQPTIQACKAHANEFLINIIRTNPPRLPIWNFHSASISAKFHIIKILP